jgi:phosphoenolpyruvate synthase/pyruvate phosphate dikinase
MQITHMQKPLYIKDMSRDACLVLLDVWVYAETSGFKDWIGVETPKNPGIFCHNKDGLCAVYYDEEHINWVKKILLDKVSQDSNFIKETIDKYLSLMTPLLDIANSDAILSKEELIDYYQKARYAWTGLEVAYRFPYVDEDKACAEDISYAKNARIQTEKFFDFSDALFRKSLTKLFPHIPKLIKYLTIEEIKTNNIPSKEILLKRHQEYIFVDDQLIEGQTLKQFEKIAKIEVEKPSIKKDQTIIVGKAAMPGEVTGPVRVILTKDKINTLQEGEILVAPMTTPAYLPAMYKAVGFITDEGGVTCHAAIVAREMKKPCIVGTKIATSFLKTGDIVTVNANTGEVTKKQ